jgi:hypothetical protein
MKMKRSLNWILLLSAAVLLAACRPAAGEATPTTQPEAVLTAAAQTAEAQLTELAQPTETATLTATPAVTLLPVTPTPALTVTETPGVGTEPAATLPPSGTSGDQAEYWADITVPDGTEFGPGEAFTKTWRLINSGTTNWTPEYSLAFLGGSQMSGPPSVNLTTTVAPGDTVDISVDMVSPQESGNYQGFWKMRNAAGEFFDFAVFVEINVVGGAPAPTATTGGGGGGGGAGTLSNVTLSVDDDSPEGCPHTFNFTASFNLSADETVSYRLDAGSDTAGFTFDLPAEATRAFDAGTQSLPFTLSISSAVNGWVQFHVTSPADLLSEQVQFSLVCN